ncbi:hypothetical protein BD779DRAFT_1522597 [Infundibulicybe gibba]|nr:hypothetical protein BD779DRAFT_1522597 [Infundibulicybe gibba]
MVSADNLKLDVLELIFMYLPRTDLPSMALVSRSFLAGVVPQLYSTLCIHQGHAKLFPSLLSPFKIIMAHPSLAVYVKHKLVSFRCTVGMLLPAILPTLRGKHRLEDIRVHSSFTEEETSELTQISSLRSLALDFGSWNVIDGLPKWTRRLRGTLTSLTLYMCDRLNSDILGATLSQLPKLAGLHIVGCAGFGHGMILQLLNSTPLLQNLSFTITENKVKSTAEPSLDILESVLQHLQFSTPNISSVTIKLSQRKVQVGDRLIRQVIKNYAHGVRRLAFLDCQLGLGSIANICKECKKMERLDIALPMKELAAFTAAICRSSSISTLVDTGLHITHIPQPSLTQEHVRRMMSKVRDLRKIASGGRVWTVGC